MQTKIFKVDNHVDDLSTYPQIKEAAALLQAGELVAFPTETVYGLGANALDPTAVKKIFTAKGRPSDNPLIIHIADFSQLTTLVHVVSSTVKKLMDAFWPGPLTIVLTNKSNTISSNVTAGLDTIAVRMPDHPIALALIQAANLPIAAPSANSSGRPSPTTANHVQADLNHRIAAIIDGGATTIGLESTVIDCTSEVPMILRPGAIAKEQIETLIGPVQIDTAVADQKKAAKSPGTKYTHYAPQAPFYLIDGSPEFLQAYVTKNRANHLRVGVLTTDEKRANYTADIVLSLGSRHSLDTVASNLYQRLRQFDDAQVDVIFGEVFPDHHLGYAIMNRLRKAAGNQLIIEMNHSSD